MMVVRSGVGVGSGADPVSSRGTRSGIAFPMGIASLPRTTTMPLIAFSKASGYLRTKLDAERSIGLFYEPAGLVDGRRDLAPDFFPHPPAAWRRIRLDLHRGVLRHQTELRDDSSVRIGLDLQFDRRIGGIGRNQERTDVDAWLLWVVLR